jgi:hypothetical protein
MEGDVGDANFSGGGSVTWEVSNSDGESGGGDRNRCSGRDRDPKGPGGVFRVIVNGETVAQVPVNNSTVRVTWTP